MKYRFKASEEYWRNFYALSSSQKHSVRKAWDIFKADPFHATLGTHKIHSLSVRYKTNVWSVVIEADLRVVFMMEKDLIYTIDIGTHKIYD